MTTGDDAVDVSVERINEAASRAILDGLLCVELLRGVLDATGEWTIRRSDHPTLFETLYETHSGDGFYVTPEQVELLRRRFKLARSEP
jgi:hypothetical protein